MKFEYYVLNESWNRQEIKPFNIFENYYVQERTEKAIRKYLRSPKKFKYIKQHKNEFLDREEIAIYGFEALCEEIRSAIMCEEWCRCEYEICVGSLFTTELHDILWDIDKGDIAIEDLYETIKKRDERNHRLKKIDCYQQALPNIPMIVRECIYQYKEQLKK